MDRKQMIDEMEWLTPDSGTGFGICAVGNAMMWAMAKPDEDHPDLKSVVAIKGDPDDYTDEELAALHEFSQQRTAKYDQHFRWRLGCNTIIIGKETWGNRTTWLRKRLSWDMGRMWSETLKEAIAVFDEN